MVLGAWCLGWRRHAVTAAKQADALRARPAADEGAASSSVKRSSSAERRIEDDDEDDDDDDEDDIIAEQHTERRCRCAVTAKRAAGSGIHHHCLCRNLCRCLPITPRAFSPQPPENTFSQRKVKPLVAGNPLPLRFTLGDVAFGALPRFAPNARGKPATSTLDRHPCPATLTRPASAAPDQPAAGRVRGGVWSEQSSFFRNR